MIRWYIADKAKYEANGIMVTGSPFDNMSFGPGGSCANYGLSDKTKVMCRVEAEQKIHDEIVDKAIGKPITPEIADKKADTIFMNATLSSAALTEYSEMTKYSEELLPTDKMGIVIMSKLKRSFRGD